MSRVIAYVASLTLLVLLIVGLFYPMKGLVTLSVTAIWILSLLALPIAFIIICVAALYDSVKTEDSKTKLATCLISCAKKRSVIGRFAGWLEFIAMSVLLGYGGFIFTAVVYVLSSLLMRFARSMARDEAVKNGLA
ncbi:MAG: hypothetical protein E6Z53_11890 [Pantoea sp.]|nr:hypothetical protein [Pantoea sp.]